MSLYRNQRADPATGRVPPQPAAGKSADACPTCDRKHGPGRCRNRGDDNQPSASPKCEACGSMARQGKTMCRPCAKSQGKPGRSSKGQKSDSGKVPKPKPPGTKKAKRGFVWSEVSTIHIKGVAKNRWRRTYDGPPVRHESYLRETDEGIGTERP